MDSFPAEIARSATSSQRGFGQLAVRALVVGIPPIVLAMGAFVLPEANQTLYWVGAALVGALAAVLLPQPRLSTPATGLAVIAEYVIAQVWLWFCKVTYHQHWYPHFALGLLLIVPLLIFAAVTLERSGAPALRRARIYSRRLLRRTDWPDDLSLCQTLPEVKGLRAAIQDDATPALALLNHSHVAIRAAGLAALAYRPTWGYGEAERVQAVGQRASEPPVRAAAIRALAGSRDPFIVETIAQALCDPSPDVRKAASEVLLWDGERRWSWVRFNVHAALADPTLRDDGPLPLGGVSLPAQAVNDLHEWTNEGGDLGVRAASTLVNYYTQVLNAKPDPESIAAGLRQRLLDPDAPTPFRVELAQMLAEHRLLDAATRTGLLAPDFPAPLRLVGAEASLTFGPDQAAESTLREIARRPNREIALAVAQIVQRRLGVDMGLDLHHLPASHTRRAAEVTRRVMDWAAGESEKSSSEPATMHPTSEWDLPSPEPGTNPSRW